MNTIYKVTNKINGKAYIGFDSNWPSRKSVHKCEALTRKNKKYPLYRAIRKYGFDNFEWEILYQNDDKDHTLNVMENKLILEHNTHFKDGHGYNMTYGGEGAFGWVPTDENKQNISESKKGQPSPIKGLSRPWLSERNKKNTGFIAKNSKTYKVTHPNGDEVLIQGIVRFCRENALDSSCMFAVARGRHKQHKGWKCELVT